MRRFTEEEDAVIVQHYATLTLHAIAARLGREFGAVQQRSYALIRAGRLSMSDRYYHRPWTDDEDDLLADRWGKLPDRTVAKMLSRSINACKIRATRELHMSHANNLYTARDVGRLFGVDAKTVLTWLKRGWLTGRWSPVRCGTRRKWDISEESIEKFIRERPWCYRWQLMPESWHRNLAERVWRADPYLTLDEVAAAVGWQQPRVDRWVKRGYLPFVRRQRAGTKAGPWAGEILVRRSDLAGFCERVAVAVHENRSRSARKRTMRHGGWGRYRRQQQEVAA